MNIKQKKRLLHVLIIIAFFGLPKYIGKLVTAKDLLICECMEKGSFYVKGLFHEVVFMLFLGLIYLVYKYIRYDIKW